MVAWGGGHGFHQKQGCPYLACNPGSNTSSQQQSLRQWQQPALSGHLFTTDLLPPLVFTTLNGRHYDHFIEEIQLCE